METIVNTINEYLWLYVLTYGLLAAGLYLTFKLGFIQFRHVREMIRTISASGEREIGSISPFQALTISLASRVGTGNIVGVAIALFYGGPGAIFWMWLVALLGMATAFSESTLAQLYKARTEDGSIRGGPEFYIARGLKLPWLGTVFAVLFAIAGLVFASVQSNSIAGAMNGAFNFPTWMTGAVVSILIGVVIHGGISRIASVAEVIVPFMAAAYVFIALVVMAINITEVPDVIGTIFASAFGWQEAAGGAAGGVFAAMLNGVQRGLFSNEAGMGTVPHIAASATPNPHHPVAQGFVQALSVFIDTIVICTATAILILTSGVMGSDSTLKGIELTQAALSAHIGGAGSYFLAIAVLFFAFTTIMGIYSFTENAISIVFGSNAVVQTMLKAVLLAATFWGSLQTVTLVFNMADAIMGILATINLVVILLLSGTVRKLTADYIAQRRTGEPEFDIASFPELQDRVEPGIWSKEAASTSEAAKPAAKHAK